MVLIFSLWLQVIINALTTDHAASQIALCIFAADQAMTKELKQCKPTSVEQYAMVPHSNWTMRKITCDTNGLGKNLRWASTRTRANKMIESPVAVEAIELIESLGAALCGPTVYSNISWIPDYVEHYLRLGVTEFHFYKPEGVLVEEFLQDSQGFLQDKSKSGGIFTSMKGSLSSKRLVKYEHPAVKWHNFTSTLGSDSFGLRTGNNDCISRVKYSHKYAVIADIDEFLHIPKRANVPSITAYMDKYLPERVAALGFVDLHYARDCPTSDLGFDSDSQPITWSGLFPDQYRLHHDVGIQDDAHAMYWSLNGPSKENVFTSIYVKSVVKVSEVFSVHYHGPDKLQDPRSYHSWYMPHFLGHFKHIRYLGPTRCTYGRAAEVDWLTNSDALLHWVEE
jgi:hypothetical protein